MHNFLCFELCSSVHTQHNTLITNEGACTNKVVSFPHLSINVNPQHQQFKRKNVWKGNEGRFFCERIELFGVCRIEDDCDVSDEYLSTSHQNHTTFQDWAVSQSRFACSTCAREKTEASWNTSLICAISQLSSNSSLSPRGKKRNATITLYGESTTLQQNRTSKDGRIRLHCYITFTM